MTSADRIQRQDDDCVSIYPSQHDEYVELRLVNKDDVEVACLSLGAGVGVTIPFEDLRRVVDRLLDRRRELWPDV